MNITIVRTLHQFTFQEIGAAVGFEYPEARVVIEDVGGNNSAEYVNSKAGRRRLSWEALIENTPANITAVQRALRQGRLKTIFFQTCSGLSLQTDVEIDNFIMPYREGRRRRALVEAIAPDWRFYSQTENYLDTLNTTIKGGLAIPAAIPYDIGSSATSDALTVDNVGSEVTNPRFRIYGPGTSFVIGNLTTGESLTLAYNLTTGNFIEINVATAEILLNGTTNIYSALTAGDFFLLQPGENEITFETAGQDVTTKLEVYWRAAYGGI